MLSLQVGLVTLLLSPTPLLAGTEHGGLSVYDPVPGLDASPYYSIAVREEGSLSWLPTFTLLTECTGEKFCNTTGAFDLLAGWSNSYINLEISEDITVEIKIRKLDGDQNITKAVVRPETAAVGCEIRDGEVIVTINKPVLFTVDINGQMEDQDTGRLPNNGGQYEGPPLHTVTIFANPFISKPSLSDPGVFQVSPGQEAPTEGPWHTLYFLPGLHDIGLEFLIHANKSYYIPGDAVVYGTLSKDENVSHDGENIHIYGHGTLSGDKLPHHSHATTPPEDNWKYRPIRIKNPYNVTVEGITIANSAGHSISLSIGHNSDHPDDIIRWVKIFTWRGNGDGVGSSGNQVVEDCFVRTQDDSSYVGGRGMRRVVFWQDFNGSTFVMSHIGSGTPSEDPLIIEDCTVVYCRSKFHHAAGGSVWNMRGRGYGSGGSTITFRNIRVEDPRPTHMHFKIMMEAVPPWGNSDDRKRGPGDLYGITFQNISISAHAVVEDEPELLWGMEDGLIYGLIFDNVTISGETVDTVEYFYHNEFVFDDLK